MKSHFGVVESIDDPFKLGRCKVRIVGLHTADKTILPTEDLPWAKVLTSVGSSPKPYALGSSVSVSFADDKMQDAIIFGEVPRIPQSEIAKSLSAGSGTIFTDGGKQRDSHGNFITNALGDVQSIQSSLQQIIDAGGAPANEAKQIMQAAQDAVQRCEQELINAAKAAIDAAIKAIEDEIKNLVADALDAFGSLPGMDLIHTIATTVGGVKDEVTGAIGKIVATERSVLRGINSISCGAIISPSHMIGALESQGADLVRGFKDPTGVNPPPEDKNTNPHRLAIGETKGTHLDYTDKNRVEKIPIAGSKNTWEEFKIPFGGDYPHVTVKETASGYVDIKDDTPEFESVTKITRKGSYTCDAPNGSKTTKIVGDGYTIYDRNGYVYIDGSCNVTIGNSCNLLVQGNTTLQSWGTTSLVCHNVLNVGVAGNVNFSVGGDFNVNCDGKFKVSAKEDIALKSLIGEFRAQSIGQLSLKSASIIAVDGLAFYGQSGRAKSIIDFTDFLLKVPEKSKGRSDKFAEPLKCKTRKA